MGPTRKRDLAAAVALAAILGYLAVVLTYHWFPPVTTWTGLSLLVLALGEAAWAFVVRSKISGGHIGEGAGRLHPLTVARSVVIGKASVWVGAPVLGWWLAVLAFLLQHRNRAVAVADTGGAVVAAVSALALVVAALWLQHCCRSPLDPPDEADGAPE